MSRCKSRGLSLIEVLLATAILSLLAGVCASLFQDLPRATAGRRASNAHREAMSFAALSIAADEFMKSDALSVQLDAMESSFEIDGFGSDDMLLGEAAPMSVHIRLLEPVRADSAEQIEAGGPHAWIVFRSRNTGDRFVLRWLPRSPAHEDGAEPTANERREDSE